MTGKRAGTLLALMEHIERFTLHRAWTDLRDEELFWEPAAGAWGIRRRDECPGDDLMEQPTATYTYAPEPPRGGLMVVGPPGPEAPGYVTVAGALHEISRHGTQVCVLRDLHRWAR